MSSASSVSKTAARATRRAAAVAALVPGVLLVTPLLLGQMWGDIDAQRLELAMMCAFREQARLDHGVWLLSLIGNGTPTFGFASNALYPLRWLQLTLPPDVGASLSPVAHLAGGAAATAWLARTYRLRVPAAATAGLLFVLCGTTVDLISKPSYAAGALYIPLVWAAARRALSVRGGAAHVAVVFAGLTLELLGGEAQTYGIILAILLVELVLGWRRGARLGRIGPLLVVVLASLCVGWMQWGQTLAEATLTARSVALGERAYRWSFDPVGWLSAVWPAAATTFSTSGMLAQMLSDRPNEPLAWNLRAYVGLLFLAALVVGVTGRRLVSATLVFAGFFLASLGDQTPFLPALNAVVPLLERFKYPAKYLVPAMTAAAILVGYALERAVRGPAGRRRLAVAGLAALAVNAAALGWLFVYRDAITFRLPGFGPAFAPGRPTLAEVFERGALHTGLFLGVALAVLYLPRARRPLVYAVAVADLALAAPLVVSPHPPLADVHGPLAQLRAPDGAAPASVPVVCVPPRFQGLNMLHVDGARVEVEMRTVRFLGVPELQACDGVSGAWNYTAPLTPRTVDQLAARLNRRSAAAARALGCTHVFDDRQPPGAGVQLLPSYEPGGPYFDPQPSAPRLFELTERIPPAFVVRAPAWVAEDEVPDRVDAVDGVDALLRLIDDPRSDDRAPLPDGAGVTGVEVTWEVRDEATVTVAGRGGAVVGLRTTHRVGWEAEQAGAPLRTVRVAGVQQAAVVPDVARGPIRFRYRPPGWPGALGIGAIGGILALLAALWRRRTAARGP